MQSIYVDNKNKVNNFEILNDYLKQTDNIKVPNLIVISNSNETQSSCEKLGGSVWVVKAQVHAGGRGKGGGVIVCHEIEDAVKASEKLLGSNLITP